jgi:hypothetical protein
MNDPSRRLRVVLVLPAAFVVIPVVLIWPVFLALFVVHIGSPFCVSYCCDGRYAPSVLGGCEMSQPALVCNAQTPVGVDTKKQIFFVGRSRPCKNPSITNWEAGEEGAQEGSDGSRRVPRGPTRESRHPG